MENINTIHVRNLVPSSTESSLLRFFSRYGVVKGINVMMTSEVAAEAYIEYINPDDAVKALIMDHKMIGQMECTVSLEELDHMTLYDPSLIVFVDNIPASMTAYDLEDSLIEFGELQYVNILTVSCETGDFIRGQIVFSTVDAAYNAVVQRNGCNLGDNTISVYMPYITSEVANETVAETANETPVEASGSLKTDAVEGVQCLVVGSPEKWSINEFAMLFETCGAVLNAVVSPAGLIITFDTLNTMSAAIAMCNMGGFMDGNQMYQLTLTPINQTEPTVVSTPACGVLQAGENGLLVENIIAHGDETVVRDIFSNFGEITQVRFIDNTTVGLYFAEAHDAETAANAMNGRDIDGCILKISHLIPNGGTNAIVIDTMKKKHSKEFDNEFVSFAQDLLNKYQNTRVNTLIGANATSPVPLYARPIVSIPRPALGDVPPMATMPVTVGFDDEAPIREDRRDMQKPIIVPIARIIKKEQDEETSTITPAVTETPSVTETVASVNEVAPISEEDAYRSSYVAILSEQISYFGGIDIESLQQLDEEVQYKYVNEFLYPIIASVDPKNYTMIAEGIWQAGIENVVMAINDAEIMFDAISSVRQSLSL